MKHKVREMFLTILRLFVMSATTTSVLATAKFIVIIEYISEKLIAGLNSLLKGYTIWMRLG